MNVPVSQNQDTNHGKRKYFPGIRGEEASRSNLAMCQEALPAMQCFAPQISKHGCGETSAAITAQRPPRVQGQRKTPGEQGNAQQSPLSPLAQALRHQRTYTFEDGLSACLDVSCKAAPGTVSKCPCCGTATMTDVADDCEGVAGMCDNRRWEWRGEPPFCCHCASRKGIGYACICVIVCIC